MLEVLLDLIAAALSTCAFQSWEVVGVWVVHKSANCARTTVHGCQQFLIRPRTGFDAIGGLASCYFWTWSAWNLLLSS